MEVINRETVSFSYLRVAWQAGAYFWLTLTRQLPAENPCSFSLQMNEPISNLSLQASHLLDTFHSIIVGYYNSITNSLVYEPVVLRLIRLSSLAPDTRCRVWAVMIQSTQGYELCMSNSPLGVLNELSWPAITGKVDPTGQTPGTSRSRNPLLDLRAAV